MGRVIMNAAVSLDGFIAYADDTVGPLFDYYENGEVLFAFDDRERLFNVTPQTAELLGDVAGNCGAVVIGRVLFDFTNGWNGVPATGDHVFVVTHEPPTDWEFADTAPFTFCASVREAVEGARALAGDRDVAVAAGDVGAQALREGLVDQVLLNLVPVVLGSGKPFFGTGTTEVMLDDPVRVVQGDRVTHLLYDVRR